MYNFVTAAAAVLRLDLFVIIVIVKIFANKTSKYRKIKKKKKKENILQKYFKDTA